MILTHKDGFFPFVVTDGRPGESWNDEIPVSIAIRLMDTRKFHADNDARDMLHWCWDINGTVYTWHKSTNRYEICRTEAEYKKAIHWFE